MNLTMKRNEAELTVFPDGEINALTAPKLDEFINRELPDTEKLIIDFTKCDYISSAGFRVLLAAHKALKGKGGGLVISHPGEYLTEALEATGLDGVFDIYEN